MARRTICVFSGKRGGFGAYLPLMRRIQADKDLELQMVLGDMHASAEFGSTANEAKSFFPEARIELIEMGAGRGDSQRIRTENLGTCLYKAGEILGRLKPDLLMVHADRGEHLAMAMAAAHFNIPVTHTQGGEISGNVDDVLRNAISKLAHLHFPETTVAAGRLKAIGEPAWRIHEVGSLYIDRIVAGMYTPPAVAREKFGFGKEQRYIIGLLHPDTLETPEANWQAAHNMMAAVAARARVEGWKALMVYPCSDPGYEGIINVIESWQRKDPETFLVRKNIDNQDFLGLLKEARLIIGNSSCALVEAPYLHVPAVNIGNRQRGRDREDNVLDANTSLSSISETIDEALSLDSGTLDGCGYRLGDGHSSEKVFQVIAYIPLNDRLLRKS